MFFIMILANSARYVTFCARIVWVGEDFLCFPKLNQISQMEKGRIFAYPSLLAALSGSQ